MTTSTREITAASLSVSQDTGHGGAYSTHRIARPRGGYEVSVSISSFHPGPGERLFQPSTMTQVLHKDDREAADFLSKVALVYKVFELEGLLREDERAELRGRMRGEIGNFPPRFAGGVPGM